MNPVAACCRQWTTFQLAGPVTHAVVLGLGLGGLAGRVPLPRGRRSGCGLVLMALAMAPVFVEPRGPAWALTAAGAHLTLFGVALWLLVGPAPRAAQRAAGAPARTAARPHGCC